MSTRTETKSAPIPLVRQGMEDTEPVAWACGDCGTVRQTEPEALHCYGCTVAICACGETCDRGWTACRPCRAAETATQRRKRAEAAEVLTAEEWHACRKDMEPLTDGEDYFFDGFFDYSDEPPLVDAQGRPYLWRTTWTPMRLGVADVEAMLERAGDEHHEEIGEGLDWSILTEACERWNAAHPTAGSWFPDETQRVLMPVEAEAVDP